MNHREFWKGSILTLVKIISQQPSPPREIDLREIEAFLEKVTHISENALMPSVRVSHRFRGEGTVVGYHPRSAFVIVALGSGGIRRALDPRHLRLSRLQVV